MYYEILRGGGMIACVLEEMSPLLILASMLNLRGSFTAD